MRSLWWCRTPPESRRLSAAFKSGLPTGDIWVPLGPRLAVCEQPYQPQVRVKNTYRVCPRHSCVLVHQPLFRLQVTANKKELGVAFKKDAKAIADALEGLPEDEADCLRKTLESGAHVRHSCTPGLCIKLGLAPGFLAVCIHKRPPDAAR